MIEVLKYGDTITSTHPATKEKMQMVNVIFIERGRSGINYGLTNSAEFLSDALGTEMGLENVRVHTQPIPVEKIAKVPVGQRIEGFINRILTSTAQIEAQRGAKPRNVNGRPTFFQTVIEGQPKDDLDLRVSNETLARTNPELFYQAGIGATQVIRERIERDDAGNALPANQAATPVAVGQGTEQLG